MGYGYRFYVSIELNTSEELDGYIYIYSWNEYEMYTNLRKFLNENLAYKQIDFLPTITTVSTKLINIDFAIENSKRVILLKDILNIQEREMLSFEGGNIRLYELNQAQFDLIVTNTPYIYMNEGYDELCTFFLFSRKQEFSDEKKRELQLKISNKKEKLSNEVEYIKSEKFYSFMDKIRDLLFIEDILIIQKCNSC